MKRLPPIFVDSDIVVSSLISKTGATYLLINKTSVERWISNLSQKEIKIVAERLNLDKKKSKNIFTRFKTIKLKEVTKKLKEKYISYVVDLNDAHILAGAIEAKTGFLVSYNLKHFKIDKIKADFKIIVLTPAKFLQYLRSL